MTPALRASARYWLTGLALAATGVCMNRLLAPVFDGRPRAAAALIGQLTALAGIGVIMIGIRRRVRRENEALRLNSEASTSTETVARTYSAP